MELLQTIALLCQVSMIGKPAIGWNTDSFDDQLKCQQSYIHCVRVKGGEPAQALERCILEKK